MRKEASLELWKELYETAINIGKLEPWNYFWDTDLVAIYLKGAKEPVFCSIMGRAGSCYGISVYEGWRGLGDFEMVATAQEYGMPSEYVMYEQSSLTCYWGDREETSAQQRRVIKALDLKFRGKGKWIYFNSYKPRYAPYIPDAREAQVLVDALKNLFMVVRAVKEDRLHCDFDQKEILWHKYDEKSGQYLTWAAPIPIPVQKSYPLVELHDDILKKKLKDRPYNDAEIMLEFVYMNTAVRDKKYDRPANPLLFIAFDVLEDQIITMNLMDVEDSEVDIVMNFFILFVEQYGKMQVIRARNPWVFCTLEKLCDYCDIALEPDPLEEMDTIIMELKNHMF